MLVRNFEDYSYGNTEYVGLQKNAKYWFPHAFKYVAWFIVISSVVSSSVVLILYGISFGMIKTYLWATAFSASFLIGLFIIAPVRILVLSAINSICLKRVPILRKRKMSLTLLSNPPDPVKKQKVLNYRKYNAHLYTPTPLHKLQSRFEDVKYNIELRNMAVDTITYLTFMVTVFYFVLIHKSEMEYYSNQMVSELVLSGKYTNSIPFKSVYTYDKFLEYLSLTLLPALLLDRADIALNKTQRSVWNGKDKFDFLKNSNPRKNVFEKGWTLNHCVKLLGKPRLRQIRVRGSCEQLHYLKPRNVECAPELSIFNVESRDFGLRWSPTPGLGLTPSQAIPWMYQSGWESKTLHINGKYSLYPSGGYVLNLARHIADAWVIVDFLKSFHWVDIKTRAIFIEFTLYSVNTNLFNVVTLILEKSATGYMIPSYQIQTCKFIFVKHELEYISLVMTGLFALLLFFFMLRESLRIHRTSFKTYMGWTFAVLDLAIICFGVLSFVFLILRNYYVTVLLEKLEKADNNEFVSFIYAAYWHSWSVYIKATLILLASFKLLRLLTFRVIFYQLQATLTHCYKHFIHLTLLQIIFLTAFANFFYLTLINHSEKFSKMENSLSTLFGRGVAYDDTFDLKLLSEGFMFLTPFFFCLFIVFIAILFVNMFIAIICLYFHVVRAVSLRNKYNILEYVKFLLTKKRQKDIMHLKYKEKYDNEDVQLENLRLKGGGNKQSKKKSIKQVKEDRKRDKDEQKKEIEIRKVLLKDFINEKLYDTVRYIDLKESRKFAMRNLLASFLADDEKQKADFKENALKIFFCSLISSEEKIKKSQKNQIKGPYFSVASKSKTEIFDRRIFYEMRKVVEDFGKKQNWILDDILDEEVKCFENKLKILEKKLLLLVKKFPGRKEKRKNC